ncbi:MAG: hypothetical protein ACYDDO_13965 [Acidiferrobacterales bacterium]
MRFMMRNTLMAGFAAVGLAIILPVFAQTGGMMDDQAGMGGPGASQMSGVMHDMSGQMMEMSHRMGTGSLSAVERKRMAERMREMAGLMDSMSGMARKGMMMDEDMQKQVGTMRQRMDEMMKPSAGSSKK